MFWGARSRWKRNETRASTPSPSLHKCIKNTSACGTPPAKHLLKIMTEDHRPPKRQVNLHRISLWMSWMFLSFECCFHLSGFFLSMVFFLCMNSVCVFVFTFFLSLFCAVWLVESWCYKKGSALKLWDGRATCHMLGYQRTPSPMER